MELLVVIAVIAIPDGLASPRIVERERERQTNLLHKHSLPPVIILITRRIKGASHFQFGYS